MIRQYIMSISKQGDRISFMCRTILNQEEILCTFSMNYS